MAGKQRDRRLCDVMNIFVACVLCSFLLQNMFMVVSRALSLQTRLEEHKSDLPTTFLHTNRPLVSAKRSQSLLNISSSDTSFLSVYWEPPLNSTSFCFPWTQNTDDWWSHHPTYFISAENSSHFCFAPRPKNQGQFFQKLYDIQFRDANECSLVKSKRMWSDGWGADLRNVLDGLIEARRSGMPFQIDETPWHYAAKQDVTRPVCSSMGLSCYFLPMSNCSSSPKIVKNRANYDHGVPAYFQNRFFMEFITRQQQWLRKRIYDYVQQINITLPCAVLHVRRGDSILGTNHRRYRPIKDYVDVLKHNQRNILLLTDDSNAIKEAVEFYPDYNWMYFNRPRYRGHEGGWEEHIPSNDPAFEVIAILSELRLARTCQTLVHTASNFGQLLYAEMRSVSKDVKRVNLGD